MTTEDQYDWGPGQTSIRTRSPGESLAVKLMVEYSIELPLWGDWPAEVRLPDDLRTRLAQWQRDFDTNLRWDVGWTSTAARDRWAEQVPALASDLRRLLDGYAELEVNLWPLHPD